MHHGLIIDCDVHHGRGSDEDVLQYVSSGWREYLTGRVGLPDISWTVPDGFENPHGPYRDEAFPPEGGTPGSDYETLRAQLLDRLGIRYAFLTYDDEIGVVGLNNPYLAAEIARAINEYTAEQWLTQDERLKGSIMVGNQLPDVAAKEIRRAAKHKNMAQVLMVGNAHKYAFGHPIFHPIYEACVEVGLPLALHGGAAGGVNSAPTGAGAINTYFEYHSHWPQGLMTHFLSLVAHGVFELYPDLKVIMIEGGVGWLPPLLWRCDAEYRSLRRELPWVKRLPSEYFLENVWVSTQPIDNPPRRDLLIEMLESIGAEQRLVFSTDYPHWDGDELSFVLTRFPRSWHERVLYENASELYGIEARAEDPVGVATG